MKAKRPRKEAAGGFRIKRIYEPPAKDDGLRVLVDRLWPRGIAKEKARIDLWLKEISPSDALRRLVHGDPTKWDEFVAAYRRELAQEPAKTAAADLRKQAQEPSGHLALRGPRRDPQQRGGAEKLARACGLGRAAVIASERT